MSVEILNFSFKKRNGLSFLLSEHLGTPYTHTVKRQFQNYIRKINLGNFWKQNTTREQRYTDKKSVLLRLSGLIINLFPQQFQTPSMQHPQPSQRFEFKKLDRDRGKARIQNAECRGKRGLSCGFEQIKIRGNLRGNSPAAHQRRYSPGSPRRCLLSPLAPWIRKKVMGFI